MPQLRVSGFLDEGTDVDPRDAERLLPLSTVHVKASPATTQRGGRLMDSQSGGAQFSRGHRRKQQERLPARYPAAGSTTSMPNQRQLLSVSVGHPPSASRELQRHPPIIHAENYDARQNEINNTFTDEYSSYNSASNSIPSGAAYHNSQLLVQNTMKRSQTEFTQQRTATHPASRMEQESDDDEEHDCVCCDLQSTSRQPLCNEGTKNLCTLAIWAVIIFAICNRFLMHMSLFLHGSGSAKNVVGVVSPDDVSTLEKSGAASLTESGIIHQTMQGGR